MIPAQSDLWFLPLGGTGEIGMNLNLYGHDGAWLMVDCGVTFPKPGRIAADGTVHHRGNRRYKWRIPLSSLTAVTAWQA